MVLIFTLDHTTFNKGDDMNEFNKYQERLLQEMKLNVAPKNILINSISLINAEEALNRLDGNQIAEVIEEYARWWRNG